MDPFYPLQLLSDWLTSTVMGLSLTSRLGASIAFFLYDVPKVLLLLTVIVFVVALVRSFFPPEAARKRLSHTGLYAGNVLAAGLGVLTPFCSCSAVPMFIGFVESGVPLGVTFSFLVAAPMVNEVALALLLTMFGWKVAGLYAASGLVVAIVSGIVIGRLGMERFVEDYVWNIKFGETEVVTPTWAERLGQARSHTAEIVGKVWPYVVAALAIGAVMHGYAPEDLLARWAGPDNPFAVPLAVLIGVPLYANAAAIIPIVDVLVDKGVAMGTVLAFMMAVTALSLPEAVILRKVLKPTLLATFFGINAVGIIAVGYLFNAVLG